VREILRGRLCLSRELVRNHLAIVVARYGQAGRRVRERRLGSDGIRATGRKGLRAVAFLSKA